MSLTLSQSSIKSNCVQKRDVARKLFVKCEQMQQIVIMTVVKITAGIYRFRNY